MLRYRIVTIEDQAPVITHVTLELNIEYEKTIFIKTIEFRMLYEGNNVIHGDKGGQWKLVNGYYDIELLSKED